MSADVARILADAPDTSDGVVVGVCVYVCGFPSKRCHESNFWRLFSPPPTTDLRGPVERLFDIVANRGSILTGAAAAAASTDYDMCRKNVIRAPALPLCRLVEGDGCQYSKRASHTILHQPVDFLALLTPDHTYCVCVCV